MKTNILISALFFTGVSLLTGCLPLLPQSTKSGNDDQTIQQIQKNDFAMEINKLGEITKSPKTSPAEKAAAHRRLAIIYLLPRNPQRDEDKALNELGKYLEISPQELNQASAANWATAIKSAQEYQGLERKAQKLTDENRKLAAANKELARANKELTVNNTSLEADIEKLKNLDLSLEKKRKSLR